MAVYVDKYAVYCVLQGFLARSGRNSLRIPLCKISLFWHITFH
jgi:hypothetical protein